MSNPAPLSRTKNTVPPCCWSVPTSIRGSETFAVNFHAFPSKLSKTTRISPLSASAGRCSATRRFTYTAQVVLVLRSEFVGVVLKQQLAESVDAAKRGTQVVRNRVAERFQFAVLAFQLLNEGSARLGKLPSGVCCDHFQLFFQKLFTNVAVLIFELLPA